MCACVHVSQPIKCWPAVPSTRGPLGLTALGAGRNNLLRRAGAAFDKFGKMLELSPLGQGLATPLGKEIASVLLKVLLPNPAYCQRGTVDAFQGKI